MEQTLLINITTGKLVIGILVFFLGLLAVVWKGKTEIIRTIQSAMGDLKDRCISMESKMDIIIDLDKPKI